MYVEWWIVVVLPYPNWVSIKPSTEQLRNNAYVLNYVLFYSDETLNHFLHHSFYVTHSSVPQIYIVCAVINQLISMCMGVLLARTSVYQVNAWYHEVQKRELDPVELES